MRLEASDLGEAVNMALKKVMAILGFSLDPDDRCISRYIEGQDDYPELCPQRAGPR